MLPKLSPYIPGRLPKRIEADTQGPPLQKTVKRDRVLLYLGVGLLPKPYQTEVHKDTPLLLCRIMCSAGARFIQAYAANNSMVVGRILWR
jgi:hypothetical protein